MNHWVKAITTGGNLRAVAIQATDLAQEMAKTHGIQGTAAQMLGESVVGALMLAASAKPGERVNLNIRSTGNIYQTLVDARPEGTVRGYIVQKSDWGLAASDTRLGPWGEGLISVLRTRTARVGAPYIGTVPILTGHFAKDLTFYLLQSEQLPSAIALSVKCEGSNFKVATGVLVQALPGASPDEIKRIEAHIQDLGQFLDELDAETNPLFLISKIFQDEAFVKLEEKEIYFQCDCSMERVLRSLTLVGEEEINTILNTQGMAQITCDFCAKQYNIESDQLEELLQKN